MTSRTNQPALWLSLQLPHLALDLLTRGLAPGDRRPVAVSDGNARKPGVLDCNPAAQRAGIRPGLPTSAAAALCENLYLATRDTDAEHRALQCLASVCYRYSSLVSVLPQRNALLLEAGASQRLFGSAPAMAERLESEFLQLGYHARTGTAPTPEAAFLAAGHALHINQPAELRGALRPLPLDSLWLNTVQKTALGKMGFRSIGEILRLPRKALARRMGPATVDYLDRLTGSRPDPQTPWRPPEQFSAGLELAAEIASTQGLLFPLKRLLAELCGVLRARDYGIQELSIHLRFDRAAEDRDGEHLRLGMQQPTRDEARILLLLRERLERLQLPRPVCHVNLEASRLLPFRAAQEGLLRDDPETGEQPVGPLLERLQARLGDESVRGLKGVEDHRPEYSWSLRGPDEAAECTAMPHRPVWLFASPQRCHIGDYQLITGPERIETGWWDGHDCRRDYYVVRDRRGRTLWAFREYKPGNGWFLQGMFG